MAQVSAPWTILVVALGMANLGLWFTRARLLVTTGGVPWRWSGAIVGAIAAAAVWAVLARLLLGPLSRLSDAGAWGQLALLAVAIGIGLAGFTGAGVGFGFTYLVWQPSPTLVSWVAVPMLAAFVVGVLARLAQHVPASAGGRRPRSAPLQPDMEAPSELDRTTWLWEITDQATEQFGGHDAAGTLAHAEAELAQLPTPPGAVAEPAGPGIGQETVDTQVERCAIEAFNASLLWQVTHSAKELGQIDKALSAAEEGWNLVSSARAGHRDLLDWLNDLSPDWLNALSAVGPSDEMQETLTKLAGRIEYLQFDFPSQLAFLHGSVLHDNDRALEYQRQVLAWAETRGSPYHQAVALVNLASTYNLVGRHADGEEHARQALALVPAMEQADVRQVVIDQVRWSALHAVGNAARLSGRRDDAVAYFDQALEFAGELAGELDDHSAEAQSLTARAAALVALGDHEAAQHAAEQAVSYAEELQSESFLRVTHMLAGQVYEQIDTVAAAEAALQHYRRSIEIIEQTRRGISDELRQVQFLDDIRRTDAYRGAVATSLRLRSNSEAFEFAERGKARAMLERLGSGAPPATEADVAAMLADAPGTAHLVFYYQLDDEVVTFVFSPGRTDPQMWRHPIDWDELRRFAATTLGGPGQLREFFASGLEELWHRYDFLLEPLARWTAPGETAVIVPHATLHQLPLHALRIDGRFLVERNPVAYAPSAGVLAATVRGTASTSAGTGGHLASLVCGDSRGDLPYARAEAEAVGRLLGVTPLLGDEVTRDALAGSLPAAGIVHIAGHAQFDDREPMRSGLSLADGDILTAQEIRDLNLSRGSLVILSGCQTGVSRHHPGDELIGLTRALLTAGAGAVVVSHWRVDDESTAYLMEGLYDRLLATPTVTRAHALQHAMRRTMTNPDWQTFYHWAPFHLAGNWQ
jgi:tetratricopeptide (TPR) repeat protein